MKNQHQPSDFRSLNSLQTLKRTRQALRKGAPRAERELWKHLRKQQMRGLRFRRQFSIGPYVVDFYCPEVKIGIEVDGASHFAYGAKARDEVREAFLNGIGVRLIRVQNISVSNGSATEIIGDWLDALLRETASQLPDIERNSSPNDP